MDEPTGNSASEIYTQQARNKIELFKKGENQKNAFIPSEIFEDDKGKISLIGKRAAERSQARETGSKDVCGPKYAKRRIVSVTDKSIWTELESVKTQVKIYLK